MSSWIKITRDLSKRPEVFALSCTLGIDTYGIVGRLSDFWGWVDANTPDGHIPRIGAAQVDHIVTTPGFADALVAVGWLEITPEGITLPHWDRHNSQSAKARALEAEAAAIRRRAKKLSNKPPANCRTTVRQNAAQKSDQRREEKNTSINQSSAPPSAPAASHCTLDEAFAYADTFNISTAAGFQIPRHVVTLWHDDRSSTGWTKVKNTLEIPVTDWKADLRLYAQHYAKNERSLPVTAGKPTSSTLPPPKVTTAAKPTANGSRW